MKYWFTIIVLFLLFSCDSNYETNQVRHTMNDGTTFYTDGEVHIYDDFESFLGIQRPAEPSTSTADSQEWEKDSTYCYDKIVIRKWETAKLGDWVRLYGVNPQKNYYVSTLQVTRMLHVHSDRIVTCPVYSVENRDSIGLRESGNCWGFEVSSHHTNLCEVYTIIKRIEYDENGETVGVYIPIEPEYLKWTFYTIKNIW